MDEASAGPVVAVVHAKGTSTRVPGKNLRRLGDRPLICWAIANASSAREVDEVVIDSESEEILRLGAAAGARPLRRRVELATNATTGDALAYWQATALPHASVIAQVIPTSPFLRPESIDAAVTMLRRRSLDTVVGVRVESCYSWVDGHPAYRRADGSTPNSVDLPRSVRETTGLYVNRRAAILRTGRRVSDACAPYPLSAIEAIDINDEDEFALAELVAAGLLSTRVGECA